MTKGRNLNNRSKKRKQPPPPSQGIPSIETVETVRSEYYRDLHIMIEKMTAMAKEMKTKKALLDNHIRELRTVDHQAAEKISSIGTQPDTSFLFVYGVGYYAVDTRGEIPKAGFCVFVIFLDDEDARKYVTIHTRAFYKESVSSPETDTVVLRYVPIRLDALVSRADAMMSLLQPYFSEEEERLKPAKPMCIGNVMKYITFG